MQRESFSPRQNIKQGMGAPKARPRVPKPQTKPQPQGLFGARTYLSRRELREALKKDSGAIPGFPTRKFGSKERMELEKDFSGDPRYVSKEGLQRRIKQLELGKHKSPTIDQRFKTEQKINYLRRLLKGS